MVVIVFAAWKAGLRDTEVVTGVSGQVVNVLCVANSLLYDKHIEDTQTKNYIANHPIGARLDSTGANLPELSHNE